jgi:DNA-binding transcriptional regulator YdaS (Cro superfamily)
MTEERFFDLVAYFGSQSKMAMELDVSRSAVSHWRERGVIPAAHAIKIEIITEGEFKAVELAS